jgi:Insertion element 4 transposase N-terminal/Transposase DDE domain
VALVSVVAEDHSASMGDLEETWAEALEFTSEFTPAAFTRLFEALDPTWFEEALLTTGTGTIRRRRLTAERMMWLILGISLMRNWPITEVARRLEIALPSLDGSLTVASSALTQARVRLGAEPMEWLFLRSSEAWANASADKDRWRGLALYAVDGTTLRVADSQENRAHFGSQDGGGDHGISGYPLMRVVVLMAVRSHLLAAAAFGPYSNGERAYAATLWTSVPDRSLVLIDRLYLQADILLPLTTTGTERHWLTRAKSNTAFAHIKQLGSGDDLVEFEVSREARAKDPTLPTHFDARAISYQRKGYAPAILLTSLTDAKRYPAAELRALYHERWEIELGFGEIKTELLERLETLRSKSPTAVAQEMWGLLVAYNLVRIEMERLAAELKVEPTRISFIAALRSFVEQWLWASDTPSVGAVPGRLATMRDRLRHYVLPPRRPQRVFPRAVKIKMSNYDRKRPGKSSSRKAAK